MRISDWSSECALPISAGNGGSEARVDTRNILDETGIVNMMRLVVETTLLARERVRRLAVEIGVVGEEAGIGQAEGGERRSEEHTSELQSLMRISYAVFCLKKKTTPTQALLHH